MFKIGICDDSLPVCQELEELILQYQEEKKQEIQVECFYTGESSCKRLRGGAYFDLLFLDIELETMDGIEVGRILREELQENTTQIIYISGKTEYAMDLFDNSPMKFLIKPLKAEQVWKYLEKAKRLSEQGKEVFSFQMGKDWYRIPYRDILYFESSNKRIRLVTEREEYLFYGKLPYIEQEVPDHIFVMCHKSFLVNYLHTTHCCLEFLELTNGEKIPVSESFRKKTRSFLMERRKER